MNTLSAHSGADFEAARLAPRNGEQPHGDDRVTDAREEDGARRNASAARSPSQTNTLKSMLLGGGERTYQSGRAVRQKTTPGQSEVADYESWLLLEPEAEAAAEADA
jgi:hypothetical protein